jgi:phosphoglycolate phosphatase-like HAD superfamily hydrolase
MGNSGSNGAQTLLIDADDTLWANNIYFERAIADFISFLNHQEFTREEVRAVLNEVERECIVKHGYGTHSFAHALVDTFERSPSNHSRLRFTKRFTASPMPLPNIRLNRSTACPKPSNTYQNAITSLC